jgi:hypothetical protein
LKADARYKRGAVYYQDLFRNGSRKNPSPLTFPSESPVLIGDLEGKMKGEEVYAYSI